MAVRNVAGYEEELDGQATGLGPLFFAGLVPLFPSLTATGRTERTRFRRFAPASLVLPEGPIKPKQINGLRPFGAAFLYTLMQASVQRLHKKNSPALTR